MQNRAIRFWIGLFVLTAFGLMGLMIVWFTGVPDYFQETNEYTVVFDFAPNVAAGVPVRKSGVPIGKVNDVTLNDETGKVDVVIAINPKYTLRKGDEPMLKTALLGSEAVIDFVPPSKKVADRSPLVVGARIKGIVAPTPQSFINETSKVITPAQDTMIVFKKLLEKTDKFAPIVEETVTNFRDVAKAINLIVPELAKTNAQLQTVVKKVDGGIPGVMKTNDEVQLAVRNLGKVAERVDVLIRSNEIRIDQIIANLDRSLKGMTELLGEENQKNLTIAIANFRKGSDRLDKLATGAVDLLKDGQGTLAKLDGTLVRADKVFINLQKATEPFANDSKGILKNLEESTHKINLAMTDVREILSMVKTKDGTIQRLLTDSSLYRRLDAAMDDIGKIVQIVMTKDGTVQRLLADPSLYRNLDDAVCFVVKSLPRIERIMRDIEIFTDKLARHPELLGVRGALYPSTGLKNPPSILHYHGP